MQLLTYELDNFSESETAVALGTFDGLHIGHRRILDNARSSGLPLVAYSFENIPAAYFGKPVHAIHTRAEKIERFRAYGVDYLMLVPFDQTIMQMPAEQFLDFLYDRLNARVISCGFNYTFGRNAEGTPAILRAYCAEKGIRTMIADPVTLGGETVSSTNIREALRAGNPTKANAMLGSCFSISGIVVHGKHLGNKIGFPTANLSFGEEKLAPKFGVYATAAIIGEKRFPAMTNVGVRPTVEQNALPNAETYIIGYTGNLYGETIRVDFLDYIRPEQRFESIAHLREQLKKDEKTALQTYLRML